jgi:hypothetical protein
MAYGRRSRSMQAQHAARSSTGRETAIMRAATDLHHDRGVVDLGRPQRRHVDEVGQVSAAEAWGAARNDLQVVRQMAGESQGATQAQVRGLHKECY